MIDSGATATFIPKHVTEELGITLNESNYNVIGAGGDFLPHIGSIESLKVINNHVELVEFTNLDVYVNPQETGFPFVLLGRDTIFSKFNIRFEEINQEIHLLKPK